MLERVRGWLRRSWRRVLLIALAVYLVGPELVIAERTRVKHFDERAVKELYVGLYTMHPALRVFEWRPSVGVQGFGICEEFQFRCR